MTVAPPENDIESFIIENLDFAPGCALKRRFGAGGHSPCPNEAEWMVILRKPCGHPGAVPLCDPCYQRAFINADEIYTWVCTDPTGDGAPCRTQYTPKSFVIDVQKI